MRKVLILAGAVVVILVSARTHMLERAFADITIAARHVPHAQQIGKGTLSFLFWDVYHATLYAPQGQWKADQPYALSIAYLLELNGKEIAQRSVEEMRKQGFNDEDKLALWQKKMEQLFPDVDENTTLTGIRNAQGHALFYQNENPIGTVRDPEFSDRFFAIWLSEKTSEPRLRKKLLRIVP